MSIYTGKFDFYDYISNKITNNFSEFANNTKIQVGDSDKPLEIKEYKDLIPYFPHLVSMASYNKHPYKAYIQLTKESSIDIDEKDFLTRCKNFVIREYKRCKRKHEEFSVDEAVKKAAHCYGNESIFQEIASRVKNDGEKASLDGIHTWTCEMGREELVNEMLRYGLDPEEYGLERFLYR